MIENSFNDTMSKQLHTDCSILRAKLPAVAAIKLSIKVRKPDLFKHIVQKYDIMTRSGSFLSLSLSSSLPLILLRLLKNVGGMTKLININTNNINKILNTGIRQYIDLYMTIQSRKNAYVSRIYKNPLSPGRYVPEQVNVRTDHVNDKDHVVIPILMRYLQRIDDQVDFNRFQPLSTKTSPTVEFALPTPEKVVFQRERIDNAGHERTQFQNIVKTMTTNQSKNYLNKSKNYLKKSLNKSQNYPDEDNDPDLTGIGKIQASRMQIEKTGSFSGLQHLNIPDTPLFNEYTPNVASGFSGVGENTKGIGVMGYSLNHMEENIPEIGAIVGYIQKVTNLVYEKHNTFNRRTADRYLMTGKINVPSKLILNKHIIITGKTNVGAGKIHKTLPNQNGIYSQHFGYAKTGMSEPLNGSLNIIATNPHDLVFRNTSVHSAGKGLEDTGKPDITKTERTEINAGKEDIMRTNITARDNIGEIAIIADMVYKSLETRISIEKERRGL